MSPLSDVEMLSEEEENSGARRFTQPGSIVSLRFVNFMQYTETEFQCGPNLNVIIGPNGSGKSSIVNGICLGLAGRTNLLGRSTDIQDFIRVGEEEATIEIELFNPHPANVRIRRRFDRSGVSRWAVDGKSCGVREVERTVGQFRIQVDNLCQFLPQDKVHDFSKLNSRGLLDSTVDAVGDLELKNKHRELKELQRTLSEGEDLFERKKQMLEDRREQCRKLEEDVQAFEEKKQIELKIELAEGKLAWSKFYEKRREARGVNERSVAQADKVNKQLDRLKPIEASVVEVRGKKEELERKLEALTGTVRSSQRAAQTQTRRMEELEENLHEAEDDLENLERTAEQRKTEIKRLETILAELELEYKSSEDDHTLQPQLEEAKRVSSSLEARLETGNNQVEAGKFQEDRLRAELDHRQVELLKLSDTEKMKLRKLQQLSEDTFKAVLWLRENLQIFRHRVFEPFLLCGNVRSPSDSIYLENTIKPRDLLAFFFEDSEDMNRFLKIVREEKGLRKVSAVQTPRRELRAYQAPIRGEELKRWSFISYLKDLVDAPNEVLSFMCHQYGLHRVPVFSGKADGSLETIIQMGFTKFFTGTKIQSVSGSLYSAAKATMTREVLPRRILEISRDIGREKLLKEEISEIKRNLVELTDQTESVRVKVQSLSEELEKARRKQKELEQRRHTRLRLAAKIRSQRTLLKQKMSEVGGNREREEIEANRRSLVLQLVSANKQLAASISRASNVSAELEVTRLTIRPLEAIIESRGKALQEARSELNELEREKEKLEEEVRVARDELKQELRLAIGVTGMNNRKKDEPPAPVRESWEAEGIPDNSDEIQTFKTELEAKADCIDSVDRKTVEEYTELKLTIRELEAELKQREDLMSSKSSKLQHLKESWLESLRSLVEKINANFSSYFSWLGFAGEVGLDTGLHENDFENYGVKVRVKFRDSEPLQDLTAHRQSGGERSVATALYMLALQELTTVPFRCVDEINQGMDATNERRVFELLVQTSCYRSSSQYFLLTPKLLSGLRYSPRMNVLIVYNGPNMCDSEQWNRNMLHRVN